MSEFMVDVGLNLNADNYVTTMGQALNLTKQYAEVATGVPGAVQSLSQGMVKATGAVTGFNKVQTVAIDTAASYEKQLSKIESKAVITGQNFDKLSKTTKGWAKDFPIGMGEASKVMETLQSQGIKTEKQMGTLGKSFIRLGAATGTNASAIGSEFLQLSRSMGNSSNQFEKLSDSLVTTTAKIGGSAPSVVAFSKALAPVASTVGMSQTAVMGLSTAMSKLGEDGGYAANSFNKVMLDMNRAMRDGGPELKAYSEMLGMTSQGLKSMFNTDPAEVLARFSEAVSKEGPNITRTLEALGFDSVRTTRSLTALSNSGELRSSMDTAIESYGDGSTQKAADAAMDGVTDSAMKLQETMGQVVQDVGQPMLGFTKALMEPVNMVASGVQGATSSNVGQAVLGAGGIGGTVAGMAGTVVTAGTMAFLGKMAFDVLKPRVESMASNFKAGGADSRAGLGAPRPGIGPSGAAGYARAAGMASMIGQREVNPAGAGARLFGAANRLSGAGLEAANRYQAMTANMARGVIGGQWGVTPAMQGTRDDAKAATRQMATAARAGDTAGMRAGAGAMGAAAGRYGQGFGGGVTAGRLATAAGIAVGVPARMATGLGVMGLRGAGAAMSGLGALGINPAMLGIAAVAGGGIYAYSQTKKRNENLERIEGGNDDIYARFNDFAEATGQAGRGVVSFAEKIEKTSDTLIDANKTWEQTLTVDAQEFSNATSPNYKPVLEVFGEDQTPEALTTAVINTLPTDATMSDVSRLLSDVASISKDQSVVDQVSKNVAEFVGPNATNKNSVDVQTLFDTLVQNKGDWKTFGLTADQGQIVGDSLGRLNQKAAAADEVYGGEITYEDGTISASRATKLLELEKQFNDVTSGKKLNYQEDDAFKKYFAQGLGMTEEDELDTLFDVSTWSANDPISGSGKTLQEVLGLEGEVTSGFVKEYQAINKSGTSLNKDGSISYAPEFASESGPLQKGTEGYLSSLSQVKGAGEEFSVVLNGLTDILYAREDAARETGKVREYVNELDVFNQNGSFPFVEAQNNSSDSKVVQEAVDSLTDQLDKQTGSYTETQYALKMLAAEAPSIGPEQQIFQGASEQLSAQQAIAQAGRSQYKNLNDQIELGQIAQNAPTTSNTVGINREFILGGQQAQTQVLTSAADINRSYGAMQQQIGATQRSAGISIAGVRAQTATSMDRAKEDYATQRQYGREDLKITKSRAREDFNISSGNATRDFNKSMDRAEEDYTISKERAKVDHNKQLLRSDLDFQKETGRANADFNKGQLRAQRDYDTMETRANRDFNLSRKRSGEDYEKSVTRSTEDYNKSKIRMIADYGKQVARMTQDAAKSMYDPFKRIQVAMVMDAGQLLTNLSDQKNQIDKQVDNLASARSMGITDATIQALGLADAANAQQLARLVGDMSGNAGMADQLNAAVADKASSVESLVTDSGNPVFDRMQEDFDLSLDRMNEDFATAQLRSADDFAVSSARSAEDFATQMSDAYLDFNKSITDSTEDFNTSMQRSSEDYKTSIARSIEDFNTAMLHMEEDYQKSRLRAFVDFDVQMDDMRNAYLRQMSRIQEDYDRQNLRSMAALKLSLTRMLADAEFQIKQISASVAASIVSMEEAFFGMFQNSASGLQAATQFIDIVKGSKIDIKDMSDDMQAMYKAAVALVKLNNAAMKSPDESQKPWMQQGPTRDMVLGDPGADPEDPTKWSQGEWERRMSRPPVTVEVSVDPKFVYASDPVTAMMQTGAAAWDGFVAGFTGSKDAGYGIIQNVFMGVVSSIKGLFGIKSPSTVFAEIGRNVIDGFVNGISSIPSNLWNKLTESVPAVESLKNIVVGSFSSAKAWLLNLGGTNNDSVAGWVGEAWGNITDGVVGLLGIGPGSIHSKVSGAFSSVITWLVGLAGTGTDSVSEWIGTAWSHVTDKIPSIATVVENVKNAFGLGKEGGGIVGWLQGLSGDDEKGKDTVAGWIGGAWDKILTGIPGIEKVKTAFHDLGEGIEDVVNALIGAWNSLKIDISIPEWLRGKFGVPDVPSLSIGVTNPVKPVDVNLAQGGIVTRQMNALIGEAGYPEAVIPLNQRGADVLAETMARYVGNNEIRASNAMSNSSPVYNTYNQSYDYSTKYTGPISVHAQDPNEMQVKMAARKRRQRLSQPIGSRS